MILIFWPQRSTGIVKHTCWAIHIVLNGRQDIRRLAFPSRHIHLLIHPHFIRIVFRIPVFTELPVCSPPDVCTFYHIYNALALARVVAIIVFTDQVAIFIKHKFMGVAIAVSKHFEITAIGITPYDDATVGMIIIFTVYIFTVKTDIADLPVDPSIGSQFHTRHSMTAEADVNAIAMRQRGLALHQAGFVFFDAPEVWADGNKQIIAMFHYTTRGICCFVIEVFHHQL